MFNRMKAAAARTRNAAKATYARVAPIVANRARNVGAGMKSFGMAAAAKARNTYDKMREGKNAPAVAPTPYLDNNSHRIYKTNTGAVFTNGSNGNKNYKPVVGAIKNGANAPIVPINSMNVKTVPNNIRPTNNVAKINNKPANA
jgi:hypothetical protein